MNDKVSPLDPGLLTGPTPTAVAAPTTPAPTVKKAAAAKKKVAKKAKAAKKTAKPAKVAKKAAKKNAKAAKRGPGRPPKKNKTNSDVFLCIFRTDKKFIARLDKLAKKKGLNRSETIRTTLTKAIEANKF